MRNAKAPTLFFESEAEKLETIRIFEKGLSELKIRQRGGELRNSHPYLWRAYLCITNTPVD